MTIAINMSPQATFTTMDGIFSSVMSVMVVGGGASWSVELVSSSPQNMSSARLYHGFCSSAVKVWTCIITQRQGSVYI